MLLDLRPDRLLSCGDYVAQHKFVGGCGGFGELLLGGFLGVHTRTSKVGCVAESRRFLPTQVPMGVSMKAW